MVDVAEVGPLSQAEVAMIRRFRRLLSTGQGFELTLAFHARGKDSYLDVKEVTYDRQAVHRDGFLAVE